MGKSLAVSYVLWMFGGFLGLHHVYLRRYKHAFVWWCLPGGFFGLGWLRDLWRIPEYVKEANNDAQYLTDLSEAMRKRPSGPPFSLVRCVGQLVLSNTLGLIFMAAPPSKFDDLGPGVDLGPISELVAPALSASAIWIVGNVGPRKGSFRWPLIGCYLGLPLFYFRLFGYNAVTLSGILAFQWKARSWRRTVEKRTSTCRSLLLLFLCCGLYTSLWGSSVYFNLTIATAGGKDEVRFRDAVGNLIRSPAFQKFTKSFKTLFARAKSRGFDNAWQEMMDQLDPLGERSSFEVLDLDVGTSQSDIKMRYKELSKRWHPDRFTNQTEKSEAQRKFIEIQQAYENLSHIKSKRIRINKRSKDPSADS